jgi:hypothetical protein
MTPAVLKSRIQALVDMLKVNMSIHTLRLDDRYCQHKLFRGSVIPYLETNRLRPRLLAIQKTLPNTYRAKVLGRVLLSAHTNANSFWMLLSGNAEVTFPSATTAIAAAANLPTPAAAAAISTIDGAAFAGLVMTAATTGLPTAAATATTSAATSSTARMPFPLPLLLLLLLLRMLLHSILVRSAKRFLNPTSYQGLTALIAVRWGSQVADKGTLGYVGSKCYDTNHTCESALQPT